MKTFLIYVVLASLAGCASQVSRQPATLVPVVDAVGTQREIRVDGTARVRVSSGYSRDIPAGSTWTLSGTVDGHPVYKSANRIFTVEGTHVHEAYLILDGNDLIGFYLPGENAVSWLNQKVTLKFH